MPDIRISPRGVACPWLSWIRWSRLIGLFLLCLFMVAVISHIYLTDINSDPTDGQKLRIPLQTDEDETQIKKLNLEIRSLRKIKASVNNELRDMESKRQKLQVQISNYQKQIDILSAQIETSEKEIKSTQLTLEQLKLEKSEMDKQYLPILKAPIKILMGDNSNVKLPMPINGQHCKMHSCFDFSRCSVFSGFPVYFYDSEKDLNVGELVPFVKNGIDEYSEKTFTELMIRKLPFWHGDGRNHILINLMRDENADIDIFGGADTGRAIIVQSPFVKTIFRSEFDIVIPPNIGKVSGDVWEELPPISPIRRKYFLSFKGSFKGNVQFQNGEQSDEQISNVENSVISFLKNIQLKLDPEIFIEFSCDTIIPGAINGEYSMCQNDESRYELLKQSTFALIISPANESYVSTNIFQLRFYEALKYGAIPVILGDHVILPYMEILDWKKATVILPKARLTEFHFILRTFTDTAMATMRRTGRYYFETYFSSTRSILDTALALIRTRLNIPPAPMVDMKSPSVFENNSYEVFKYEELNPENDETLGPLEAVFPSVKFSNNFTQNVFYHKFTQTGDPFRNYPFTPFEHVLPSESKFIGSGYGFRPIGKGEGGAGKEFSEALGGNLPREQFTLVMLTYERSNVLITALQRLKGLPFLNKAVVVWNNPAPPTPDLKWPDIGVPIHVIKTTKNSLNNRFLPYDVIETEAILSIDDDAHLRHDEIVFGFRVWREERDRIVGFPGRFHAWDVKNNAWLYNSNYSCELSMVLTGAAFFHKYYAYMYSHVMAAAIRDKVDEYVNCEDIAMNFLVSHITRKPPVKVTSRWTFRCPGCPQTLSNDRSHFEERHKCINFFVKVYGYMPLLYTQYRVDSVLFKTRLPHDKQKCFKFI
ncbi:EXTL3 [Mytilus edulis]|uniref:glucuronosyl-galactosyl-proteoglycan 4-alpha-N-acetylglucosaminyltransferase n=1 Tax=Mytilus edulis TaxID=6550 RepID=A0A8S3PMQ0_MYTED|nr:EXTL3 [Mytilus edulis]